MSETTHDLTQRAACADCGAPLNAGEAKCFTVCDACWDKHWKTKPDLVAAGDLTQRVEEIISELGQRVDSIGRRGATREVAEALAKAEAALVQAEQEKADALRAAHIITEQWKASHLKNSEFRLATQEATIAELKTEAGMLLGQIDTLKLNAMNQEATIRQHVEHWESVSATLQLERPSTDEWRAFGSCANDLRAILPAEPTEAQ